MNPIYTEKQRLMRWWIALFLLPLPCHISYGFYEQAFLGVSFGENAIPTFALGLFMVFIWSLCLYLFFVELETIINQEGIFFRLSPTHGEFRKISWEEISTVRLNPYDKAGKINRYIAHFGTGDNVYKVFGKYAIEVLLTNQETVWLGTQNPDAAYHSLSEIKQEKLVPIEE
ncbi:MAG: hypothetical protein AAF824_04220 [Bacteroidota bacterium]